MAELVPVPVLELELLEQVPVLPELALEASAEQSAVLEQLALELALEP